VTVDANGTETEIALTELDGLVGSISCVDATCTVFSMTITTSGIEGNFGTGETLGGAVRRRRRLAALGVDPVKFATERKRRRRLGLALDTYDDLFFGSDESKLPAISEDDEDVQYDGDSNATARPRERRRLDDTSAYPSIASPVVCISKGDSILFDVSNDYYPTYEVNSLLNSNPSFDYSGFTTLAETASSTATVTSFVFGQCSEAGRIMRSSWSAEMAPSSES